MTEMASRAVRARVSVVQIKSPYDMIAPVPAPFKSPRPPNVVSVITTPHSFTLPTTLYVCDTWRCTGAGVGYQDGATAWACAAETD